MATAFVLLVILIGVTIAIVFVPGLALLAVIPLLAALGVAAWIVLTFLAGTSPGETVRKTPRRELLEPGDAEQR